MNLPLNLQFRRSRGCPSYLLEVCDRHMFSLATELRRGEHMKASNRVDRRRLATAFLATILVLQLTPIAVYAQNLGAQPATGQAVQGQTAAQPEGAVLNLVNWIGNVIAPIGAALAVVMAVIAYSQGRGVMRWSVTAGGLLVVSGLTRLIEFWIQNGTGGVQ
jgi:hypothetical protein